MVAHLVVRMHLLTEHPQTTLSSSVSTVINFDLISIVIFFFIQSRAQLFFIHVLESLNTMNLDVKGGEIIVDYYINYVKD